MRKKTFKRLAALFVIAALVFAMAGCSDSGGGSNTGGSDSSNAASEEKTYTVAYSTIADTIAPFTSKLRTYLQEKCADKGWTFNYLAAEGNVELQAEQVSTLISSQPDMLILFVGDAEMGVSYCKDAYDADIPVLLLCNSITQNAEDYCIALVATDMYQISYDQGKDIVDKHGADAGLTIVCVSGVESQLDYQLKLQGFSAAIADTNYTLVGPAYCNSSRDAAQSAMETYLATYGDAIDVVIGFDDDLTLGAVNAIAEAELTGKIEVYSQMGMNEMLQAIKDGKADQTIFLGADMITDAAIDTIAKYFAGESFDFNIAPDVPVIDAANVDEFEGDF